MSLINSALNFGLLSVSKKVGPVSIVLDKVFRKQGPTQEESEALAAANDEARRRRVAETTGTPGWPFVNHAANLRRTRSLETVMVVPRMKFTFLVEFRIDQDWLRSGHMITNLQERQLISDGSIYIPVQSIDHPQVSFDVETLRSANRYVKVPKKMEYEPASIRFHDDVTSMIAALRKEYIHFYHYNGDVGQKMGIEPTANLDVDKAWDEYQFESTGLVSPLGEDNRSRMREHPSIGLKMRSDCSKHFFKEIVIYDLGMHPDSINAYYFYHPVATRWSHDNLDYENRNEKVTMEMQFEYESYYDVIGQNNSKVDGILFQMFGFPITPAVPSDDHAKMIDPSAPAQALEVCAAATPSDVVGAPPEEEDCTEGGTVEELQEQLQRLEDTKTPSTGALATEKQQRKEELTEQLLATQDCVKRQAECPSDDTIDATERTVDKAVSEIEAACNERHANANIGADDSFLIEGTDEETIGTICQRSGQGCSALNTTLNNQTETFQRSQSAIGQVNQQLEDLQFELDQTPFTDPTRRAQLESDIATGEEYRGELEQVGEVLTNAIAVTSEERSLQQCTAAGGTNRTDVSDVAASSGADPVKCRAAAQNKEGLSTTPPGSIGSESNVLTGQARDAATAQLQALGQEQTESLAAADQADKDVEILQNMKQSGGTKGSQELSREALETLTANGGDVEDAIQQRTAAAEAERANADSLTPEITSLGNALNRVGGPTEVQPPTEAEIKRVETQQRLEGESRAAIVKQEEAQFVIDTVQHDLDILNDIQAGNPTDSNNLTAPTRQFLRGSGATLQQAIDTLNQTQELAQAELEAATEEKAVIDEKIKAP